MSDKPSSRTTVLVVEDEPLVLMHAVDMLTDAGFAVVEAPNAERALDQLKRHPEVSALFSDINMPGALDGLELARQIHATHPHVHLILTSGRVRPSKTEMENGDFVEKPSRLSVGQQLVLIHVLPERATIEARPRAIPRVGMDNLAQLMSGIWSGANGSLWRIPVVTPSQTSTCRKLTMRRAELGGLRTFGLRSPKGLCQTLRHGRTAAKQDLQGRGSGHSLQPFCSSI